MTIDTKIDSTIASIIMAAGRGSRMKGYDGNKTLLPLVSGSSVFEGEKPILLHLLQNLPKGPTVIIVNHCKEDVMSATASLDVSYCEQPALNGTGGAILASETFISAQPADNIIITMGDVPFVSNSTYSNLVQQLDQNDLVILGFCPADKKQYGVLEIEEGRVSRITEWKYWKDYSEEQIAALTICNSGIYAAKKEALVKYLPILASRPQIVQKEVNGKMTAIEEFFITDIIEYMVKDGRPVGYSVTEDEMETMGIDDADALQKAQDIFSLL
jgi:bifunctional UDP-N-acetylglucosamine pyrophosphorylase/glucosamine-1-phosphate N-acetyltransferase